MDDAWDFDERYNRDCDREPGHSRPPRRSERPALNPHGTLRQNFARDEWRHERWDTLEERRGDK